MDFLFFIFFVVGKNGFVLLILVLFLVEIEEGEGFNGEVIL